MYPCHTEASITDGTEKLQLENSDSKHLKESYSLFQIFLGHFCRSSSMQREQRDTGYQLSTLNIPENGVSQQTVFT